jgi:NAD-dependent SIR2 family protein deacetylase
MAIPEITADDFSRRFAFRSKNLMWLLGAGVSASAGIPTAWDMVWEFKQALFTSQRRVSPKLVSDLSNEAVRTQIQAHIDSVGGFPPADDPGEYADLFEAAYPAERDRQSYIDARIVGAKPSYAHLAIATLMKGQLARLVWTTNFDPLMADACAKIYDATGPLTTVALDAPALASQAIAAERWPIEIKIHGDFRSRRLKNTTEELRQQDALLRRQLVTSCCRFGLIVGGYSGRDSSVMDALEDAVGTSEPFPAGLFWLHRGESDPLPRVVQLLQKAVDAKVEAALVRIENFDEALRDAIRLFQELDTTFLENFERQRRRWSAATRPSGTKRWPGIRLNGLHVSSSPTVCRRVVCDIGGSADVRDAIERFGASTLTARTRAGVLAFGSDSDLKSALGNFSITAFDLHTIEARRLRYDSGERGLLRNSLGCAIARHRSLTLIRRRNTDLLFPADVKDARWSRLQALVGNLAGTVSGNSKLIWREGVGIRLDWAHDRLWLLVDPRTIFEGIDEDNRAAAADFARERSVKRYNRQFNELLAYWAALLSGDGEDLRALGISDGVDAVFRLSAEMAFSKRAGA